MTVSNETNKLVGKCHICEINVYDRGALNKPFKTVLGNIKQGYPNAVAMPCGVDRTDQLAYNDPAAQSAAKEMSKEQFARCPFETKEQQNQIEYKKGVGVISGNNTWDGIV